MKMNKQYRRGGFFGNSQDKFSDMEGAGQGINMAYKSQGKFPGLGGQGAALRREKRYLKKLERQGKLNDEGPRSADRLDYLKKVQRDRIKKGVGAAALAAGAVATGGALAANPGALSGLAGKAGAGLSKAGGAIKGGLANAKAAIGKSGAADLIRGLKNKPKGEVMEGLKKMAVNKLEGGADGLDKGLKFPDMDPGLDRSLQAGLNDPDMQPGEENIDDDAFNAMETVDPSGGETLMDRIALGEYGHELPSGRRMRQSGRSISDGLNLENLFSLLQNYRRGEQGMKVLKGGQKKLDKNNDGQITGEDFKLLQAMKAMYGAKLPR